MSEVWKHFIKGVNGQAQCNYCFKKIACKGSSTSGMLRHLERLHELEYKGIIIKNSPSSSTNYGKRKCTDSIIKLSKQKNLTEVISRLVAEDGIPISAIYNSSYIQETLTNKNYSLPKNQSDISKLIISFYETVKQEQILTIEKFTDSKRRYSITLNELINIRNKKYFNVILHLDDGNNLDLGLVRIPGKCTTNNIYNLLNIHLQEFGISLKNHIVAVTTEMQKFGDELPIENLLCLNQAIYLAVIDVLYQIKNSTNESSTEESDDDIDSEDTNYTNYDSSIFDNIYNGRMEISRDDIKDAINDTRNIIKIFKKSPGNNSVLQHYVEKEFNKEYHLILDQNNKWNSLINMIERFLKLKNCITNTLKDLNMSDIWNEQNINILENILEVLLPIKIAIEALNRRDTNYLTAEAITTFMLKKLSGIKSNLGQSMYSALITRITERRDKKIICLLKYLHYSEIIHEDLFPSCSKSLLISFAENLMSRLFLSYTDDTNNEDQIIVPKKEVIFESVKDELESIILNIQNQQTILKDNQYKKLKKEFSVLESTGKRTDNLELLYRALLTIKPTSTEKERIFSVSGTTLRKIRNFKSDDLINALLFLKTYFNNQKFN